MITNQILCLQNNYDKLNDLQMPITFMKSIFMFYTKSNILKLPSSAHQVLPSFP